MRYCLNSSGCDADSEWTALDDTGDNATTTATTATVSGLTNGTSYQVQVRAGNSVGDGAWSSSSTEKPSTVPGKPAAPTLAVQDQGLGVEWSAPSATGGADISGYKVGRCSTGCGTDSNWTVATLSSTGTTTTLSGLTNGTEYQVRVAATNRSGDSAWSTPATATPADEPAQPSAPTVVAWNLSLRLSWTAPAANGAAITDYDVRYRACTATPTTCANNATWGNWTNRTGETASDTATKVTVTGLTNGTAYQVQVRAANSEGESLWSLSATGTPAAQKPDAPSAPTLTAKNQSLDVSWTAPADNGASISDYDVRYRACTATPKTCASNATWGSWTDRTGETTADTATKVTVTGLTNATAYQVQVRAFNSEGESLWSSSATGTPTPQKPDAPAAPTLTVKNKSLGVSWTAPANNGAAISDYDVRQRITDTNQTQPGNQPGTWKNHTHNGTATTTTISSLYNGYNFDVQVRATNSKGTSGWSASATAAPAPQPPDAPTGPTVAARHQGLAVSWSAPSINGSAINGYNVQYRIKDTNGTTPGDQPGSWTSHTHTGTTTAATITGLTNGTDYQVQVRATSTAGTGSWSPSGEGTPAIQAPDAPATPTLTAKNQSIEVSWTAPTANGATIADYDVQYQACTATPKTCTTNPTWGSWTDRTGETTSDTATKVTATGLTNGTAYQVQVRAANSVGESEWSASATATPSTTPGVPTVTLSGIAGSPTSTRVSWSLSDDGGSPITSYGIDYRCNPGAGWATSPSNNNREWTVLPPATSRDSSLAECSSKLSTTEYQFRVRARNTNGAGSWSQVKATSKPVAIAASAVTAAVSGSNVVLTWSAPADGGLAITDYKVRHRVKDTNGTTPGNQPGTWTRLSGSDDPGTATTATISGWTFGTEYQVEVQTTNSMGGTWSATKDVTHAWPPAAPTAPTLTTDNASLAASWSAPTTNGSAITGYGVQYRVKDTNSTTEGDQPGSWQAYTHTGTTTTTTITGLTNDTAYEVQIRAKSAAGDSAWSPSGEGTPAAKVPDTPAAPTVRGNVPNNNHGITISWVAPAANGSAITSYKTRYCLNNTEDCDTNSVGYFNWTVTNHQSASTSAIVTSKFAISAILKVQVQACNGVGCSGWSSSAVGKAGPNVPLPPAAPTLTAGNTTLGVSWTAPSDNGGRGISGYNVQYCDTDAVGANCGVTDNGWSNWTFSSTGDTTSTTITGLTNTHTYRVRVLAKNSIGSGGWSVPTSEKVGLAPAAPAAPTLTTGNARLSVSWTAPANNGAALSGFSVQYCDTSAANASCGNSGTSWQDFTFSSTGATTSTTVTGLTNGNAYKVRVRAVNAVGSGDWSPTASKKAGLPAVPAAPTATSGNASVAVTWTAPADNGTALSGFGVQYCDTSAANASCGDSGTSWQTWTFSSTGATTSTTVTGLTNGHTYKVRVRAANTHGSGEWSPTGSAKPATAPDAPAAPTLTVKDKSLGVSWTAPGNGGSAITDYDVQYRKQNSDNSWPETWTSHTHTGTATSTTISSLTNLSQYEVQVRAANDYNGDNTNDPGDWSASATATPDVAPAAPAAPTLTVKHQSLDVEWSAPTGNGGSAVTGYKVRHCDNSTGCDAESEWTIKTLNSTGTTTTVTGLTNGTTYQVQVAAVNDVGTGAWSSSTNGVPATVPGQPAAPTLTVKDESLGVEWSPPSSNGGSAVIGYQVRSCDSSTGCDADSEWTIKVLNSTGTTTTVTGLTNSTSYRVQVAATNGQGTGAWSSSATATPAKAPEAPAAPTLTKGARSLSVSWTAPTNNGAAISDYDVQYRITDTNQNQNGNQPGSWNSHPHTGTATTATISSLVNGTDYDVQVAARNSQGTSDWSASGTAAPEDKPAAPAAPTLTTAVVSQQISVSWTAPSDNGQAISDYDVRYQACTATDKSCTTSPSWGSWTTLSGNADPGTATTATITGLTNGTAYQVQVRATNSVETGDWSSSATGTPATVPGTSAAPTLTALNEALNVDYQQPADNGGSALISFVIAHRACTATDKSCKTSPSWGSWTENEYTAITTKIVSNLTNGTAHEVRLRFRNRAGYGAWSLSSTASPTPQAPESPSAPTLKSKDKSLEVSWTAPTANGAAISDYDVQYRACTATPKTCTTSPTWGNWTSRSHTGTATTTTISSLTNGTAYQVQVRATNSPGTSDWSSSSSAIPLSAPSAPGRPTLTVHPERLEVSWTAPTNTGGSAITSYKVGYCDNSTGCADDDDWTVDSSSGTDTTTDIYNLTNGTTYRVRVAAVNSKGTGPWSSDRTGKPVDVPSVPGDVDVVSGPRSLIVSWTASSDTGGSAITRYEVRYCDESVTCPDDDDWTVKNASSSATSYTISSLTNNNSYSVEVRARNSVGVSTWSGSTSGTPGAPGKPSNLRLTAPTDGGQLNATWSAPSKGGADIDGYELEYCNSTDNDCTDSSNWNNAGHSGTTASGNISGLTNGKAYKVRVRATNSIGSGAWSSEATKTPAAVPQAPDAPTLTIKNRGIDVVWSAPSDTGGSALTGFKVRYRKKDTNSTTPGDQPGSWTTKNVSGGATTTTSLSSLTNGTAYQVEVAAVNGVGTGSWSSIYRRHPGGQAIDAHQAHAGSQAPGSRGVVDHPRRQRFTHHRLQRAVPGLHRHPQDLRVESDVGELDLPRPLRHQHHRHDYQPYQRHRLPSAGAGQERQRQQRLVGVGQGHPEGRARRARRADGDRG